MCKTEHRCWFKDTLVNCTEESSRSRREVQQVNTTFSLTFVIVGQISDQSRLTITELDQEEIFTNLLEISDAIVASIDVGEFSWPVLEYTAEALSIEFKPLEFQAAECSTGQISNNVKPEHPACRKCFDVRHYAFIYSF